MQRFSLNWLQSRPNQSPRNPIRGHTAPFCTKEGSPERGEGGECGNVPKRVAIAVVCRDSDHSFVRCERKVVAPRPRERNVL